MVTVHVGKDSLKQSFLVHRELLTLHSEYFRSLLTAKIKTEIKDEDETKIKIEKGEKPGQGLPTIPDTRSPSPSEENSQTPENALRSASFSEKSGSLCSPSPSSPSPSVNAVWPIYREADTASQSSVKSQTPVTAQPTIEATPAAQTVSEIHVPEINPTHFAAFLSFLYINSITPSIADLQTSSTSHLYPTMYILGCQLLSPSFFNYIMEALRRDVHGEWPSAEQAKHIYEITSSFTPLASRTSNLGKDGVTMLKKFTASCMAANNVFERHVEGTPEHDEWNKLFSAKPEIGMDVLRAHSSQWHERKPWDDVHRKKFLVEKGLGDNQGDVINRGQGNGT
jgi:hypothetical protein